MVSLSPALISAGVGAAGSVLDAFGGPAPIIGTTQADVQKAAGAAAKGFGTAADIGRGGFTVGGQELTLPTQVTKADRRAAIADAAKAEALSRGLTDRKAERFAKRASKGQLGKKGKRRFKEFLRGEGDEYGLGISSTGRITMAPTSPGGFGPSGTGTGVAAATGDPNIALQEGLAGIAPGLGEDVRAGLGLRSEVRDYLSGMLPSMGDEGLTAADEADLAAMRAQGTRNVQEQFRDDLQQVTGGLLGRGFSSSNLAGQALQRGAFDPYSRNLVDLEASQARMADQLKTSAAGRRSQSIRNILGIESGLGGASAAPITSAFVSPSAYGGWTAPQAFQAALSGLQTSMGLYTDKGRTMADIYRTPTIQTDF